MNNIQNSLFETMKIFSEASSSSDTKIIQGTITEIIDEGLGSYTVEYLSNSFIVYSNNNIEYTIGDVVYIIVPGGDFSSTKTILGLVTPHLSLYSSTADTRNYYDVSNNFIDNNDLSNIIKMSSYDTINGGQDIEINKLEGFGDIISNYLKDYNTFDLSCYIKTSLNTNQQNTGNYGIELKLPLIINAADGSGVTEQVWKSYILDVGNMLGNPYRLTEWAPQHLYFTIDSQYKYDNSRIPTLSYFCYNFPQDKSQKDIMDIQIQDISLSIVNQLSEEEKNGYKLILQATEGEYFAEKYAPTKTIKASLRIDNKQTNISKAEIYWFKEDASIKPDSEYYLNYGGYGWRCLNDRTNIMKNPDGSVTFNYINNISELEVKQNDVKTSLRYKCVVLYRDTQVSSTIVIKNLSNIYLFDLVSTTGSNTYIKDTGYVDLTITTYGQNITNIEDNRNSIIYSWIRYNKNGKFIDNANDILTVVNYNTMKTKNMNGTERSCYETRVKFPVNEIEDYNIFYCSAHYVHLVNDELIDEIIGTKEIVISTSEEYQYILHIENGDKIYKYDTDGDSPAGSAYDGPSTSKVKTIPALTYTLRKADGIELTEEEYFFCFYSWKIAKNSLITIDDYTREDDDYWYLEGYGNKTPLAYGIANRYNISKTNNTIELQVNFQGNIIRDSSAISFIKEGQGGSNGSAYVAQLVSDAILKDDCVPYATMQNGVARKLKFVYNNNRLYRQDCLNHKLISWDDEKIRIYTRVYENGLEMNYTSVEADGNNEYIYKEGSLVKYRIQYSMFDDKNTNPCFKIANVNYGGVELALSKIPKIDEEYCNILQVMVTIVDGNYGTFGKDEILYAYYPIELTITNFENNNILPTIDGGFAEVMYAADGTNPSWDETAPFVCHDVHLIEPNLAKYFSVKWESSSNMSPAEGEGENYSVKPINKYISGDTFNYVKNIISFNEVKENALVKEKNDNLNMVEYRKKQITEIENNYDFLIEFAKKYKSKKWNEELDSIQELLDEKTQCVYRLFDINDYLIELDNYFNIQEEIGVTKIREICATTFEELENIVINIYNALIQIQELDNTEGKTFDNLISLIPMTWNEELKNRYIEALGLDASLSLELFIQKVNQGILDYESELKKLKNLANKKYIEVYNNLRNEMLDMATTIDDNAFESYKDIKNKIIYYVDYFNKITSIKDIKQCIADIYTNVLSSLFKLVDGELEFRQSTINEKEYLIKELEDLNNISQKKIEQIDNILLVKEKKIVTIRPIVMYFNRYGMSNLNGWDGNKISVGDNDEYLLAPQVGAGKKNPDNSFTGIVLGLKNVTSTNEQKTGLFGYKEGIQSIFMDADTGAAIFGKADGGGQITIDPTQDKGLIYSNSFFKKYDKYTGMPQNYGTTNYAKEGMIIDFSTPEIRFGNGNFIVTKEGELTAAGGGNIAGWKISDTKIYSNISETNGRITLDSGATVKENTDEFGNKQYDYGYGKIYSHSHNSLTNTGKGFYLSYDGLSIDKTLRATNDGSLEIGNLNSTRHWIINGNTNDSYIGYNATSFNSNTSSVYIGTDGISLGQDKFWVKRSGELWSTSGTIAGWNISSNSLSKNGIEINSNGSIKNGDNWSISSNGQANFNNLYANGSGQIAGWSISSNQLTGGSTTLNSNGTITCVNLIAQNQGQVGGWSISGSQLSGGGITLNGAAGSIRGTGFSLSPSGFSLTSGTISLGSSSYGGNGISYGSGGLTIGGTIYAASGKIGGWTIESGRLVSGNASLSSGGSIYCSSVDSSGTLRAAGKIYAQGRDVMNDIDSVKKALDDYKSSNDGKWKNQQTQNSLMVGNINNLSKSLNNKANKGTYGGTTSSGDTFRITI